MNPNSQGMNLGTAHGKVIISTNVAQAMQQAQTDVQNGVRRIGSSLQSMGSQLSGIGSSITAWTAPIAAIGVAGLKTAGGFQASMKEIEARTGLTGEALEKVRDKALDLGAATEFSSQQASDAFLQLLTAGLSTDQAYIAIDNVLTAATASGEDLGLMADQVTNVMSSFGLTAEDTTAIVETMSRAAASSPASMAQIGEAMANAGSIAKSYGISLEDTSAIMAIFAQRGIRGSEASTKLGSMLKIMNSGTAESKAAWDALGTSLFDANGNAREFGDVIQDIEKGLEGKTEEEKATIIQDLAGSYGLAGINALLASDGIDAMRETMEGQQSAIDVADAKMGTFLGSLTSLRGSIETLMIHSFTPFMEDILTPFIKQLIDIVNLMSAWAKENPETTKTIAKIGAALVSLGPILFIAGKAITLIGAAIAFIASPIGIVIAGITALGVAFMKDFGGIRSFVMPILRNLWEGIYRIRDAIHLFLADLRFMGLEKAIGGIFGTEFLHRGGGSLEGVLTAIMPIDDARPIVEFFLNTFNSIRDTITGVIDTLRPLFAEIGEFLGNLFGNIDLGQLFQIGRTLLSLTNPIGIAMTALNALGVDIGQIFRDGVAAATRFFGALNDGGTVFDGLRAAFGDSSFIDGLETGFTNVINFINMTVIPGLQALADWFTTTALPGVLSFIQTTVLPGIQTFIDVLGKVWTDVSPHLASLFDWFITVGLPLIVDFINVTVVPALETMVSILEGIWEAVSPSLELLYNWFVTSALPEIVEFIKGPFTLALIGIRDFLAGLWAKVKVGVELFRDGLATVMRFVKDNILQPVLDIINDIMDAINFLPDTVNKISGNLGVIMEADPEDLARVDILGALGAAFRDNGGPGQAGMPYLIGKGAQPELFVPKSDGQFIPNFDKMMEGAGGITLTGDIIVQGARTYEEGLNAGRGAADGLMERLRSRGN